MSEPPRPLFKKRPRPTRADGTARTTDEAAASSSPAAPSPALPERTDLNDGGAELTARDVGFYRLAVMASYADEGICRLFSWQAEALSLPGVLDGGANLVYTAPTSGGKTLVAEMLLLRRLEEGGAHAKAIFVVPYKAIVDEKVRYFERVLRGTRTTVAAYYGGRGTLPVPNKLNLAVCTMEKADVLVQSMATQGRLGELVAAVVSTCYSPPTHHHRPTTHPPLATHLSPLTTHLSPLSYSLLLTPHHLPFTPYHLPRTYAPTYYVPTYRLLPTRSTSSTRWARSVAATSRRYSPSCCASEGSSTSAGRGRCARRSARRRRPTAPSPAAPG